MIVEQAQKLTDHLCRQQIIKEEEKSIYYFCFEVMISTIYFWLIALAFGCAQRTDRGERALSGCVYPDALSGRRLSCR